MKKIQAVLAITMFLSVLCVSSAVFSETAMEQLENMENTGATFDGSDGRRSGMDIDFIDTTIEIPEPTAQAVDTDNE